MKVIICGGGTVGHLTPGISIAEIILKNDSKNEVLFIGRSGGDENDVIIKKGFCIKTVTVSGFSRKLTLKNFKTISILRKALKDAEQILKEEKPNIVIGTGGYVCWPVIRAAQKLKIPTMLHESNCVPGIATRLLYKKCSKVLLNFQESAEEFKKKESLVHVGNPLPDSFESISREDARKRLGLNKNDFFILSFGGSGGAKKLNESILSLMKSYSSKKETVKHIHASGKRYYEELKNEHKLLTQGYNGCKIVPFIEEMALYMKAADTVISRCGAMTLSEIAECNVPPILIPSPNVTNNHQYKNAKAFNDMGAAIMIEESELKDRTLLDAVRYLEKNSIACEKMKTKLINFKTKNTKEVIYKLIKENAK